MALMSILDSVLGNGSSTDTSGGSGSSDSLAAYNAGNDPLLNPPADTTAAPAADISSQNGSAGVPVPAGWQDYGGGMYWNGTQLIDMTGGGSGTVIYDPNANPGSSSGSSDPTGSYNQFSGQISDTGKSTNPLSTLGSILNGIGKPGTSNSALGTGISSVLKDLGLSDPSYQAGLAAMLLALNNRQQQTTNSNTIANNIASAAPWRNTSLSPLATSIGTAQRRNAFTGAKFAAGGPTSPLSMLAAKSRSSHQGFVPGQTGGQADDVPARLSHGEYVMDADTVSSLGDGNNEAGAAKLDQMRQNIRAHKRSGPLSSIPPKAKPPLAYMKGGQ